MSDAQLSRIGLQVARDASGKPMQVLNNSQQVLKDFIDVQPEYNIQSATKVLGGITNPATGAFYQAQDIYTMANHYMEKYARLSREAAEERIKPLNVGEQKRPRGRYNLLTGEEGYEYSDYTDY